MELRMDLFEDIRKLLQCPYLSDLKSAPYHAAARALLRKMDLHQYPLRQLSDMAQYLYGNTEPFQCLEDALDFFAVGGLESGTPSQDTFL